MFYLQGKHLFFIPVEQFMAIHTRNGFVYLSHRFQNRGLDSLASLLQIFCWSLSVWTAHTQLTAHLLWYIRVNDLGEPRCSVFQQICSVTNPVTIFFFQLSHLAQFIYTFIHLYIYLYIHVVADLQLTWHFNFN